MGINDPHDRRRIRRIKAGIKGNVQGTRCYASCTLITLFYAPTILVVFVCDGVERPGINVSSVAEPWFHDIGPDQMKAQAIPMLPCGLYTKFTCVSKGSNCSVGSVSPGFPRATNWLVGLSHMW
jgi:hypothetical protein